MANKTRFAFKIRSSKAGNLSDHIVTAVDLAQAAEDAQRRLIGVGAKLVRVEFLGEALAEIGSARPVVPALAPPKLASARPAAKAAGEPPTRIDQLLELLSRRPGPLHLNEIALGLGITRKNANSIVMRAGRAGLVRRVGNRSGKVELIDQAPA